MLVPRELFKGVKSTYFCIVHKFAFLSLILEISMNCELHSVANGHLQLVLAFSFLYKAIDQDVFTTDFKLIVTMF